MKIKTDEISLPILKDKQVRLFLKRIDLIHPHISGNKWYKLKYNMLKVKEDNFDSLLTFGGAYSNHLVATSFAARENNISSIGVVRGEPILPLNTSLSIAKKNGMKFRYIDRSAYRSKYDSILIDSLREEFGNFYLLPEGGKNKLALRGVEEIIEKKDDYDYICCPVGTGCTISGIINTSLISQKVLGFPAINSSELLRQDIALLSNKHNWRLIKDYVFGGYAKINNDLINFIYNFYDTHNIILDGVYTAKMLFGIIDLVKKDYFPSNSLILAIHTGGVQGNKGLNDRYNLDLPHNF